MIENLPIKLATEINGVLFIDCLMLCAGNKEFVSEFDRLNKTNLQRKGTPIDLAIDEATGRLNAEMELFVDFCWEYIFTRLPRETAG